MFEKKCLTKSWEVNWVSQRRGWQSIQLNLYSCSAFLEKDYSLLEMVRKDGVVIHSTKIHYIGILDDYFLAIRLATIGDGDFIDRGGNISYDCINKKDYEFMWRFSWSVRDNYHIERNPNSANYSIIFEGATRKNPSPSYWDFIKTLNISDCDQSKSAFPWLNLQISNNKAILKTIESNRIIHEFENPNHVFFYAMQNATNKHYSFYTKSQQFLSRYYDGC